MGRDTQGLATNLGSRGSPVWTWSTAGLAQGEPQTPPNSGILPNQIRTGPDLGCGPGSEPLTAASPIVAL
jgi:hypothetical protein